MLGWQRKFTFIFKPNRSCHIACFTNNNASSIWPIYNQLYSYQLVTFQGDEETTSSGALQIGGGGGEEGGQKFGKMCFVIFEKAQSSLMRFLKISLGYF